MIATGKNCLLFIAKCLRYEDMKPSEFSKIKIKKGIPIEIPLIYIVSINA